MGLFPSFFALCLWTSPPRAVLVRIPLDRAIQYDTVRYPLERIPKEWHKDPIGSKWMHACTFVCIESNGKLTLVEVIFSAKTVHKNNTKYQTRKDFCRHYFILLIREVVRTVPVFRFVVCQGDVCERNNSNSIREKTQAQSDNNRKSCRPKDVKRARERRQKEIAYKKSNHQNHDYVY